MDKKVVPLFPILVSAPSPEELALHTERVQARKRARAAAAKRLKAIKRKVKGKQYALKMRVRATDRMIPFKPRTHEEECSNTETWKDTSILRLHYVLLIDSFMTLKSLGSLDSSKAAEIILWIKSDSDGPFSFNACVRIAAQMDAASDPAFKVPDLGQGNEVCFAGVDAETVRRLALRLVRQAYGALPDFEGRLLEGLTAAAAGDPAAMQWCLSEDDGPMTFAGCCEALGFTTQEVLALIPEIKTSVSTEDATRAFA